MSLRDTTSAKTQDSTVTSTVAGVATEEAMLFEAKPAIRGRHQSSAIPSEHGITASLRCNICKTTITDVRNGYSSAEIPVPTKALTAEYNAFEVQIRAINRLISKYA